MRRFCLLSKLAVLLLGLSTIVSPAAAQSSDAPVVIMAQTNQSVYWLGEPVVTRVRLYNWVSPSLTVSTVFGLQGQTTVRIIRDGRPGEPYRAHFEEAPTTPKPYILPYGKMLEFRFIAEYDRDTKLAFDKPGTYSMLVEQTIGCSNEYARVRTNTTYVPGLQTSEFRVVTPPDTGTEALKALLENPQAIRDINRLMASPSSLEVLTLVGEKFSSTRYAPFCLHAIGAFYLQTLGAYPGGAEKAESAFKTVVDNYPDYPLRNEVRIALAGLYRKIGRTNDAVKIAEEMLAESEDFLYAFRDTDALKPYRGQKGNPNIMLNTTNWELFGSTEMPDAYAQVETEDIAGGGGGGDQQKEQPQAEQPTQPVP